MAPRSASLSAGLAAIAIVVALLIFWRIQTGERSLPDQPLPPQPASSELAFRESYLHPLEGRSGEKSIQCGLCHESRKGADKATWKFLKERSNLSQAEWAAAIPLQAKCGICHVVPHPMTLTRTGWREAILRMETIIEQRHFLAMSSLQLQDILHYYFAFSREHFRALSPDPDPDLSPLKFEPTVFGRPPAEGELPFIGHIQVTDLDQNKDPDVLVCDTDNSQVTWASRENGLWQERVIANVPCPAHTQILTNSAGKLDIVLACQKVIEPTDDLVGSVVLLRNQGQMLFQPVTILTNISRVADVQPADFDADGDTDFVLAAYGFIMQGEVGWLENKGLGDGYLYHPIMRAAGAIHVPPIDLDRDGRMDFIALLGQEHEAIFAFINDGNGFKTPPKLLFQAATPAFGSSGIQLVDLDRDGDTDILYTNGDNMDLHTVIPRPFHGVQWLENKGNLNFAWHNIHRFYGAYSATAGDLNKDGHLDIVVTSMFNDWKDRNRASIIWLENDGKQQFKPHAIARQPIYLISSALADFNQDGSIDVLASGMHAFPPFDRISRLTLWHNRGPAIERPQIRVDSN